MPELTEKVHVNLAPEQGEKEPYDHIDLPLRDIYGIEAQLVHKVSPKEQDIRQDAQKNKNENRPQDRPGISPPIDLSCIPVKNSTDKEEERHMITMGVQPDWRIDRIKMGKYNNQDPNHLGEVQIITAFGNRFRHIQFPILH